MSNSARFLWLLILIALGWFWHHALNMAWNFYDQVVNTVPG